MVARRGMRDLDFLGIHIGLDMAEERGAEIALAGIRQHAEHRRALGCFLAGLKRRSKRAAAADTDEDPFLGRQIPAALHRLFIADTQHPALSGGFNLHARRPS